MGINGVDAVTFNSWALSIIRNATREKIFFKHRELPEFIEKINSKEHKEMVKKLLSRF